MRHPKMQDNLNEASLFIAGYREMSCLVLLPSKQELIFENFTYVIKNIVLSITLVFIIYLFIMYLFIKVCLENEPDCIYHQINV